MSLLQQPGAGTYVDYGFYQKFTSFEETIKTAFTDVINGMGNLGDVAQAIAAIGAAFYIGFKILRHLANAESVDVFPLLRPFAIGFLVLNFTIVTDFLGALIKPIEVTTQNMVDVQITRIQQLEQLREQAMNQKLAKMDQELDDLSALSHPGQYFMLLVEKEHLYLKEGFDGLVKNFFYALFLAARLVILTTRAFFLVVLTIVGPLAFALAIFTGFQDSHLMWIARYVQISLWFPLANILGSIVSYLQGKVIALQVLELQNQVPDEAQSGNLIYVVFMIIATLCYFTIPTISGYIVSSSGVGNALQRVTSLSTAMVAGVMSGRNQGAMLNGMSSMGGGIMKGAGMVGGAAVMGAGASVWAGEQMGKGIDKIQNMRNISKNQD